MYRFIIGNNKNFIFNGDYILIPLEFYTPPIIEKDNILYREIGLTKLHNKLFRKYKDFSK